MADMGAACCSTVPKCPSEPTLVVPSNDAHYENDGADMYTVLVYAHAHVPLAPKKKAE